jgi:dTMP kinase
MKVKEKKAILIAFEGIDQSGKETQAARLAERLRSKGKKVQLSGFPDYETPIGIEIKKFLNGEREFNAETRQLLYAANRYEKLEELNEWLSTMDYVILDRYKASGLAYGMITGLDLNWCIEIEKGLPPADYVFLFDTPVEASYERKPEGRDRYERQLDFLASVRQAYLSLADQYGWDVFQGNKPLEQLEEEVWNTLAGK